jgi:hypothetical protein
MELTFYKDNNINKPIKKELNDLVKQYSKHLKNEENVHEKEHSQMLIWFLGEFGSWDFDIWEIEHHFFKAYKKTVWGE